MHVCEFQLVDQITSCEALESLPMKTNGGIRGTSLYSPVTVTATRDSFVYRHGGWRSGDTKSLVVQNWNEYATTAVLSLIFTNY